MAIATVSQMCCWRRWAAGCPSSQRRFQVFQSSSNRSAMVYSSRQTTRRRLRRPWKGSWPTLNCALGWHGRRESRSRSASRLITAPNSCSLFSCLLREVKRFVRDPRSQYGPRHPDTAGGVGSAGARRTSSPESALAGQGTQGGGGSAGETSWRKEIAPRIGPSFPLSSHLLSIEKWFRRLATLGEPLADKARELFKRLGAAAPDPQRIEMRTIHGDYNHHQVILSPGRTVVVDWDKYRLADPNQDVARFTVGLQRLGQRCLGSIRALDAAAEGFLKTYVASNPSRVTTHLPFQKAATWLEHAKHDVHKQAPGWRDKAEAALDEGLRVLEQGV